MSSSPPPQVYPQVPPLDNTFGAVLVGTFIALTWVKFSLNVWLDIGRRDRLYGLVVHQSYRYFQLYPKDSVWIKALEPPRQTVNSPILTAAPCRVLETFHIVLITHSCYHYLVTNYSHPDTDSTSVWSLSLLTVTTGFIVIPIQSFFARRIFLLGCLRYRLLVVFAFVLFAAELGFLCTATAEAFIFESFTTNTWLISAGAGTAFVADGLLTAMLVHLLRAKRTGVQRMDQIMETLIYYCVNTGLLTRCAGPGFFTTG
ncbi:hypothetical protein V8D89_001684 [Ganoderma adspersum]